MFIDKLVSYFNDRVMSGDNGTTGDHNSDAIDHGFDEPSVGVGHPLILNLKVQEDFTSGGSATMTVTLQDSADGVSFDDTEISVPAQPVADLAMGWSRRIALPETVRRYTRIQYGIGTAVLTGGKMSAFLSEN